MSDSRSSFVCGFLVACCFTYGVYQTGRAFFHPKQGTDFAPAYVAAQLVRDGEIATIYDERAIAARAREIDLYRGNGIEEPIPRYSYPPWLLPAYSQMSKMSWNMARAVWFLLGLGAALSAAYLLGRILNADSSRRSAWVLAAVAATSIYFPTTYGLMDGQANDVQLLAIVACLALLKADRPFLAGLVLAPAGMWKIFTGIPLIFLLVRREWRALLGFATACAAIVLLSLPFTGLDVWANWLHLMRESYSFATARPRNHSIAASMQTLFAETALGRPISVSPVAYRVATLLLQILAVGAAGFVLAPSARRDEVRYTLQFSVTLVLAVLLVPMSWEHYGVFLLPAFLACAALALETAPTRIVAVALGASFAVWAFTLQLGSEYQALSGRLYSLVAPVKMYATLLLLGVCAWLSRQSVASGSARNSP